MKKVLVVDDELNFTNLLRLHLADKYSIISANSGEEALEKAAKEHPDVITLDILMPGMNGIEVLRKLKKKKQTKSIPVILLTVLEKVEAASVFEHIRKPLDEAQLISSIERAISSS
jgi:CheY-like chemotaxis protein